MTSLSPFATPSSLVADGHSPPTDVPSTLGTYFDHRTRHANCPNRTPTFSSHAKTCVSCTFYKMENAEITEKVRTAEELAMIHAAMMVS